MIKIIEKIKSIFFFFSFKKTLLHNVKVLHAAIETIEKRHLQEIEELKKKLNKTYHDTLEEILKIKNKIDVNYYDREQVYGAKIKIDRYLMNALNNSLDYKEHVIDHFCYIMKDTLMNAVFYKL